MIHIRIDDYEDNARRMFACGIGPELPPGDVYYFDGEYMAYRKSDCRGCNPGGPRQPGTPINKLSGTIGAPEYREFCDIAATWGYD
jgi:hypothetical protein